MYVEKLVYNIPEEFQAKFLKLDENIWSKFLSQYEFYHSKEVWKDLSKPKSLTFIIKWRSLEEWKGIPKDLLYSAQKDFNNQSTKEFEQVFKIEEVVSYVVL
jgi:uncharacterized protein (TIGR03792 family)